MPNRLRLPGLTLILEFLCIALCPLLILSSVGCQGIEKSGSSHSHRFSSRRQAEIHWSPTLYFGDMRFRFQLPANQQDAEPNFGHLNRMDYVEVDGVRVYRDRKRFKIGSTNFRWDRDSIIWIHSPPTDTTPFQRQQGPADLTFFGRGTDAVVEEQKPDGGFIWTYMNSRITLTADQQLTYQYRGTQTPYPGNTPLILGTQGELLEKRSR